MGSLFRSGPSSAALNIKSEMEAVNQANAQNAQIQAQRDQAAQSQQAQQSWLDQFIKSNSNAQLSNTQARKSQLGGFFGGTGIGAGAAGQYLDNGSPGLRATFLGR